MNKILNGINNILHYNKRLTKYSVVALCAISIIVTVSYIRSYQDRCNDYHRLMEELQAQSKTFSGDTSIVIKDLWTQKKVEINPDKQIPSASLVKLPIMAAVFQAEEEGYIKFSDKLVLKRSHKVYAKKGFYRKRTGKNFTIKEVMEKMIITSDNTATNMIVDRLGFVYLNEKFYEFGLSNTDFKRGIMELKLRKYGVDNYTTAEDMAFLLEKIYRKELVSKKASEAMLEILKKQRVNDRIPRYLPDEVDVAHKTGTLRDTVSDVGIVFTKKGDFIISVLTQNIKSWRTAKKFISRIADSTYWYYSKS